MISQRTGRSLNEGAHRLPEASRPRPAVGWLEALATPAHPLAHPGTHEIRAQIEPDEAEVRPASETSCKRPGCPYPWTGGSHLMFCQRHEDEYLDLLDDSRSESCDDAEGS